MESADDSKYDIISTLFRAVNNSLLIEVKMPKENIPGVAMTPGMNFLAGALYWVQSKEYSTERINFAKS